MRLVTLSDGRTARVENDGYAPLPGMLVDHLCRAPAKPSGALVPFDRVTLGPPIRRPGKIVCLGRNYADHARESGNEPPKSPILFAKASSSIVGPGDPIEKPATWISTTRASWRS